MPDPTRPTHDASEGGAGSLVAFPRPRPAERPHDNLPLQLTSFVGREREMAEVKRLLTDQRLLTLTGPGGCGKTRLALAVGRELVEEFEDGAWLVELASLSDPTLVPQAVASALGVREQPGRSLVETLAESLGPKETLLVLDNCEHLVEASADLADALLRACPRLRILATSREALGIAGEVGWPVPSLSLPDPRPQQPPVEELARYEAVRLFVERAAAVAPGFAITERNASAVARVCRRLEGMPLAIELAASRVKVLAVEQIAERLDDCFGLLTGGRRAALPRHRTLRATIGWSHELLSEEERASFRRLSVFAGGFALEAAEEVCAGEGVKKDEVLELLSHLVDKSVVLVEEQGGEEARYRLLEMVRQYAKEKLAESQERAATRRRHAGFFLKLAETAEPAMSGPAQETWLGRLEREHDNLRAALDWSREEEAGAEAGLRLAAALSQFWWIRGHFTEGQWHLEKLLALPRASGQSVARAKACQALGMLFHRRGNQGAGDLDKARACFEESLAIFRGLGDEPRIAEALTDLGRVGIALGEYASARPLLEESLTLQRRLGDEHGIALALMCLGWLDLLRDEHGPARLLLEEGLAIFRKLGDKFYIGACSYYLGCLACDQGEHGAAYSRFVELAEWVPLQQYRWSAPVILEGFACLAAARGQAVRALRLAGAAEEMRRAIGARLGPSWQHYLARRLEPAWEALSEKEGAAAFQEGRVLTLEEAIAYALEEAPSKEGHAADLPAQATEANLAAGLSDRELEVLRLVAEGLTDSEVAQRLYLSRRTVNAHLRSVYRKLGVPSRAAAVRRTGELGLV